MRTILYFQGNSEIPLLNIINNYCKITLTTDDILEVNNQINKNIEPLLLISYLDKIDLSYLDILKPQLYRKNFNHIIISEIDNYFKLLELTKYTPHYIHLTSSNENQLFIQIKLLEEKTNTTINENLSYPKFIKEIISDMNFNLDKNTKLNQLLENKKWCIDHTIRLFKKYTGYTPKQYYLKMKIEYAAFVIENKPEIPLKSIAYDLGFDNYNSFCFQFKKHTGKTPTEQLLSI